MRDRQTLQREAKGLRVRQTGRREVAGGGNRTRDPQQFAKEPAGVGENRLVKRGFSQDAALEMGVIQARPGQVDSVQRARGEGGVAQVGAAQVRVAQLAVVQHGPAQIDLRHECPGTAPALSQPLSHPFLA